MRKRNQRLRTRPFIQMTTRPWEKEYSVVDSHKDWRTTSQ